MSPCKRCKRASSCTDLGEHGLDLTHEDTEVLLDFVEGPWGDVPVEVARERDLVADLGLVVVDPRIRHVGQDFAGEVLLDVLGQRDVLGVSQCGVGFGIALGVGDDLGVVVVLADC